MSSETDQPRQRTVAELLAANGGDSGATGRRRRRRAADDGDPDDRAGTERDTEAVETSTAAEVAPREQAAEPGAALWTAYRAPEPPRPPEEHRTAVDPGRPEPTADRVAAVAPWDEARTEPENPTEQLPRYLDPEDETDHTGPIATAPEDPGHRAEAPSRSDLPAALDGGPPTQAAPIQLDDLDDLDDHPAGLAPVAEYDEDEVGDGADGQAAPEGRNPPGAAQAWAAVVAQWIAGAVGGALLWVGFRFLWRDLPVLAAAAAVLVTVGLVVVVRALLHNDDRRSTVYAVLVGLLLTVSPALLVVLGR